MIKAKLWKGKDLKGVWYVTYKLDGVRGLVKDDEVVSRKGKPLHNLNIVFTLGVYDFEVFCMDWETTVSMVRTHNGTLVDPKNIYSLDPVDERLMGPVLIDPTSNEIQDLMVAAIRNYGYEGLVLRQNNVWLKVKPKETYDVEVINMIEGTGKYKNMLGAMVTPMGKVGTGFTDDERRKYWWGEALPNRIEVDCMGLTPKGKFRHPRFIRERFDK